VKFSGDFAKGGTGRWSEFFDSSFDLSPALAHEAFYMADSFLAGLLAAETSCPWFIADFPAQFQDLVFKSALGSAQDFLLDVTPSHLCEALEVENLRVMSGQSKQIQSQQSAAALDASGTIFPL
jgi:hypothetical protein